MIISGTSAREKATTTSGSWLRSCIPTLTLKKSSLTQMKPESYAALIRMLAEHTDLKDLARQVDGIFSDISQGIQLVIQEKNSQNLSSLEEKLVQYDIVVTLIAKKLGIEELEYMKRVDNTLLKELAFYLPDTECPDRDRDREKEINIWKTVTRQFRKSSIIIRLAPPYCYGEQR